ncbi:twin transmembrane helix small protein [Hyphomicrobium sp. LHD-15]|uniref:twin transmembrane helix small protein n=1 Tax=Hyphomicrobium sp. LHD-15 TaxID=3072142 RepID=UPI00280C47F9|nr:twin transmembrane helix small protein [Hyphomicrobium sp. LHD-15]MDQ8698699.1 twin transmembrane helix small protein [Hyphomicrobium sp. LHD-15]
MQSLMYYLSTAAVFAVLAVLLMGLWVMTRGESPNLSQKLMRWRVGLQFAAVVMIVAYVLVRQHM